MCCYSSFLNNPHSWSFFPTLSWPHSITQTLFLPSSFPPSSSPSLPPSLPTFLSHSFPLSLSLSPSVFLSLSLSLSLTVFALRASSLYSFPSAGELLLFIKLPNSLSLSLIYSGVSIFFKILRMFQIGNLTRTKSNEIKL